MFYLYALPSNYFSSISSAEQKNIGIVSPKRIKLCRPVSGKKKLIVVVIL